MIRLWLTAAAIGGFSSVAAGSTAAHLATDDRAAELLRTGALYGMVHAAALLAVGAMVEFRNRSDVPLMIAGWSFAVGLLLFSLSLFALALTGASWLGWVTPFGGVCLLLGCLRSACRHCAAGPPWYTPRRAPPTVQTGDSRVKPAQFDYHCPASIDEAVTMLEQYSGEARVLAGGQSLVPMMNFRLAAPAAIVDLNRLPGLAGIEEANGSVRIGAMARQRQIELAPLIRQKLPLLAEAIGWIGHLPTRSRGTIGGSVAHADPAAEIPMVMQALAGEVLVRGPRGERRIAAPDLFFAPLTTSLDLDEIITGIRFPVMPPGAGYAIEEFARRKGDFAIAAIATMLVRDGERCVTARLATGGIGPVPVRLRDAEAILEQRGLGSPAIAAAAEKAAEIVEPMSDHNASADFRRHLTAVLTRRAVSKAIKERSDAGGG